VGGPIRKNKLFFFAGFDDQIVPGTTVATTGNLEPTPAGLATLTACLPNSGVIKALNVYGPYAIKYGNPTPQASSLTTRNIYNPGTTTPITCSNGSPLGAVQFAGVQRTVVNPYKEYDWMGRADYQASSKDRIYARFLRQTGNSENTSNGNQWSGYPANVPSIGYQGGLDWTRTFSPNVVNEARLNYGRLGVEFGGNSYGNTLPEMGNMAQGLATITAPSGYAGFGYANNMPQGRIVNTYQLQDNLSWTHGRHTMKAGANLTYQRSPNVFLPNYNGTYGFSSIYNYVENIPTSISITLGTPNLDFREHDNFLYVGDDWKATKNLTLNLGLSYAYYGQPANLFNKRDTANETSSAPLFNPALPLALRVFPQLPSHKKNFGPSIGFAYAPGGGKTVIRGGYRLTYDPAFYNIYLNIASATPQVLAQTLSGATANANPMPAVPLGYNVRAALASKLTLGVQDPRNFNQTTVSPNFGPDHVQGWSFGIQRQLSAHAVVESRYVGNHGGGLFQSLNGNPKISGWASAFPGQVPSGVAPCSSANAVVANAVGRVNCSLGVERIRTNTGVSDYSGWQNELRATNLWNQLTVRSSFTWSKTTDNASEIFGTQTGGTTVAFAQNPLNTLQAEHGISGLDFPAQWTLSYVEALPFHRGQQGLVGRVFGGWSVSGSYIISSGQPYSPLQYCINYCTGGGANDTTFNAAYIGIYETSRPYLLSPSAPVSKVAIYAADLCNYDGEAGCNLSPSQLVSWNAYNAQGAVQTVLPSSARFLANGGYANTVYNTPWGNVGRNTLRDAGTNRANFQITKDTRVTERVKVRFDASFLNVFNHPNFGSVDTWLDDAGYNTEGNGFGLPSLTSGGNRTIKFGLKILF
jgi:hypothetical protein